MIEGVLFRGNEVIIIPKQLRREMIQLLHKRLSHPGENSLHNLVKAKYWYPQIRDHIRAVTTSCGTCQVIKPDTRREPFGIRPTPGPPFQEVLIDHKSSLCGKKILAIIDSLSRYVYCALVPSTSWNANKQPLLDFFSRFGTPGTVRSDGGSPFSSFEFENFKKVEGFDSPSHESQRK